MLLHRSVNKQIPYMLQDVEQMEENSRIKSEAMYNLVDNSSGFFSCPVNKNCRNNCQYQCQNKVTKELIMKDS